MASRALRLFVNSTASEVRCDSAQITITEKGRDAPKVIRVGDIVHAEGIARGQLVAVHLFTRTAFFSFAGFTPETRQAFLDFLGAAGAPPAIAQGCIRGGNSGLLDLREKAFVISADGFPVLTVPYGKINQVQSTSPTDIVLNFVPDPDGESLSVLRLSVHENGPQNAKELMAALSSRTDLTVGTADYFSKLNDINFLTPRQRFDVRFCRDLLFLSNEAASHRIAYESISMVHRVECPAAGDGDAREEFLVISLLEPIRQGQSAYPHLVLKAGDDDPVEGEGLDEKERLLMDHFWHFFQACRVRTAPTTGFFEGFQEEPGIPCTYKGKQGFLYLTPEAFLYLYSPVLYIPYQRVTAIEFERITAETSRHNRAFDLTVHERNKKSQFANVDLIAGLHIAVSSGPDEREQAESAKKQASFHALQQLIEFMEKKNLPITGLKHLKKAMRSMETGSRTGTRASKIDAALKTKEELRTLGSDPSEGSESDHDFNPDAQAGSDAEGSGTEDEGEGEDESDGEADGGGDDVDDD
jgi:hypothetical protein